MHTGLVLASIVVLFAVLFFCIGCGKSDPNSTKEDSVAVAKKMADEECKNALWTFTTDDTQLKLAVRNNRPYIDMLKNPARGWNWTQIPSEVPLLSRVLIGATAHPLTWTYQGATVDVSGGKTVTLRFVSTTPNLELKSVWRARAGVGPVEHHTTILNQTGSSVVFNGNDVLAADLNVVSDNPAKVFPRSVYFNRCDYNIASDSPTALPSVTPARVGYGEEEPLPFQILQVRSSHGVYLAYDYGCGDLVTTVAANGVNINSKFCVCGDVPTTIANGEKFRLPGIMIETYKGDEDDGSNHFRRWFWRYEITPTLRDNANEPLIEVCYNANEDGKPDYLINAVKTQNFAGMGIGLFKTDAWHAGTKWGGVAGPDHPKSEELAAACHANGLKLALYYAGPVDEATLRAQYKKSHFDYYRADGNPFNPNDYHSVKAFNEMIDHLAALGIRYENCCGGGNLRSLDLCRRMTFMTHSDGTGLWPFFRHVYQWSFLIPPIQVKSDYFIANGGGVYDNGTSVAVMRGYLLGAICTGFPAHPDYQANKEQLAKVLKLYNTRQRAILRGADVYHIIPLPTAEKQWFGIQYYNTFINKGSVLLWQNGGEVSKVVKLKGLDRKAVYKLTFEDGTPQNRSMTGAELMDTGVTVAMGANASEIIWYEPGAKGEVK